MSEKRCCTCRSDLPLTEYNKRAGAADGLQSRCRACSRDWYVANRVQHMAHVRARTRRVRADYRQRLVGYLREHPCVDCGETDLRVLEFDHEDPAQKLDDVVRLADMGVSWERVAAEMAKCSVRCANCHRRRTTRMFAYWREGVEQERRSARLIAAEARLAGLQLG